MRSLDDLNVQNTWIIVTFTLGFASSLPIITSLKIFNTYFYFAGTFGKFSAENVSKLNAIKPNIVFFFFAQRFFSLAVDFKQTGHFNAK